MLSKVFWSNIKIPFLVRHRWSIDGLVVYWSTTGEPLYLLENLLGAIRELSVNFESTFGQLLSPGGQLELLDKVARSFANP